MEYLFSLLLKDLINNNAQICRFIISSPFLSILLLFFPKFLFFFSFLLKVQSFICFFFFFNTC